ncbi:MAG: L,D-transpeptidase [Synergistaceae bacterium]|nr:L,D-transpeptidase [Synergistaceae bacterium]
MERLVNWLKSVFHSDVVWLEKGQGRWVRRRRYHPVLKAAFAAMLLLLAALWGAEFYRRRAEDRPRDAADSARLTSPVAGKPEDSGDLTAAMSAPSVPGSLPPNLTVEDNEYWIRINKALFRLYLYRGDEVDRVYTVAVGKNPGDKERAGDNRTPNGIFTVQSIEDSKAWTHDFGDGKGSISGAYGPWFIRLRTGWQGIGIHGTHDPASRGTMVSEGCVRMLNDELEDLKKFAFRSMKVVIEEE